MGFALSHGSRSHGSSSSSRADPSFGDRPLGKHLGGKHCSRILICTSEVRRDGARKYGWDRFVVSLPMLFFLWPQLGYSLPGESVLSGRLVPDLLSMLRNGQTIPSILYKSLTSYCVGITVTKVRLSRSAYGRSLMYAWNSYGVMGFPWTPPFISGVHPLYAPPKHTKTRNVIWTWI